ncbi:MAG: phage minor capsid protein [Clostridiales bacterium]|nr:phage minor capsid protein [Clostridiales bacterium]
MKLADKGLNTQAQAIEEAQTEIRIAVRDGWLYRRSKSVINERVQAIIRKALLKIRIPDLRSAAYRSLNAFAERQYNTYLRHFGADTYVLVALLTLANTSAPTALKRKAERVLQQSSYALETDAKGVPLQTYAKEYLEQRVQPVITELCKQNALDPDDQLRRNSMRNRAEMEVRYNGHLEQIANLRAGGVKLVTCSVHADCSNRCYKWQGRVYSLDGTSGTTEDGKPYIPLEVATDVYYTSPNTGKTWKNGLLGFNCRHTLMPYRAGMVIPHVSRETQQKERAINMRQRELERIVRAWETEAVMNKSINPKRYKQARAEALKARKEYIKFSHDNGRAYYPSRIELL